MGKVISGVELGIQSWTGKGEPDPNKMKWKPRATDPPEPQKPPLGFFTCSGASATNPWLDLMHLQRARPGKQRARPGKGRCLWTLLPNPDSTLYRIDNHEAFLSLIERFPKKDPNNQQTGSLDWYKVSLSFDGVHVTTEAIQAEKEGSYRPPTFQDWDLESTLWLKWRFIEQEHIGPIDDDWTLISSNKKPSLT